MKVSKRNTTYNLLEYAVWTV